MPDTKFGEVTLDAHNRYRKQHGVQELNWSDDLASVAQRWADGISERGYLQNSDNAVIGENIFMSDEDLPGDAISELWYNEGECYDYDNPGWNKDCRHFTQMIWRTSTEIGVGKAKMKNSNRYIVVVNYKPAGNGNLPREFKKNVQPVTQ
ncbi:Golgi-associated plant pathogenesis-related protein 1-like [Saccoglossus kowalevskii]|uniref:Golgi-associated plant pathogenesis-related protein 1-like n=1 Tax=Saccoglossus kowalevskii TaxID=10224 RepID=A0ABM0M2U7_SACKO|nr:PREDICTED: golgi-associated plant pathogenesis-related protein 1-like [Saccoglossus kowalevskii]